jgi:hypothetical protein
MTPEIMKKHNSRAERWAAYFTDTETGRNMLACILQCNKGWNEGDNPALRVGNHIQRLFMVSSDKFHKGPYHIRKTKTFQIPDDAVDQIYNMLRCMGEELSFTLVAFPKVENSQD